ncbi:MAG: hypothetical protein QM503_00785 [Bacteroidota bacterium]
MNEHNQHILIDAISKLPEHKAPEGIWDNIEFAMLGINSKILPIHKPVASTWVEIESELAQKSIFNKNMYRILTISFLLLILGGIFFTYFKGNYNSKPAPNSNSSIGIIDSKPKANEKQENSINEATNSAENHMDSEVSIPLTKTKPKSDNIEATKKGSTTNGTMISREMIIITKLVSSQSNLIRSEGTDKFMYSIMSNSKALSNSSDAIDNDPFQDCNFQRPEQNFYIGVGAEYQYFLNEVEPENAKINYWFATDLRVEYKRNRFFIETGIGISFSKDNIDYTYDYITNELVSTYEYVDSVHYDPATGTTEYFTTTVNVYDSIPYSTQSSYDVTYNYIQIPLNFGFDVLKTDKFTIDISVGMTYYKELSIKKAFPSLSLENSRITSINISNATRNNQLYRINGGLGFNWDINRKIRLAINTSVNYFLEPIYKNMETKNNPISVGMRGGLYYKL